MDSIITLTNVHIAGTPTFFPGVTPDKNRCMMTVIKNRGKNKTSGQEMKDEFSLTFWGKYADTAAIFLNVGRCINVEAVARPYTEDTGQVKPNGKKDLQRTTNFAVRSFEFGGDTKKELVSRLTANIQLAITQGLLPPGCTITADYLLNVTRPVHYDYNPALAQQTGLYGTAKVWIKEQGGFIVPTGVAALPVTNASNASIEELEKNLASMKQAKLDAAKVSETEIVESGAETAELVEESNPEETKEEDSQDVFASAE